MALLEGLLNLDGPLRGQVQLLLGKQRGDLAHPLGRERHALQTADKPCHGLRRVLRDLVRIIEQIGDVEDGVVRPGGGAGLIPFHGQLMALGDTIPEIVSHPDAGRGVHVPLIAGLHEQIEATVLVHDHPIAGPQGQSQQMFGIQVACLRLLLPFTDIFGTIAHPLLDRKTEADDHPKAGLTWPQTLSIN